MRVFVVIVGQYDDRRVIGAYSTLGLAKERVHKLSDSYEDSDAKAIEYELDCKNTSEDETVWNIRRPTDAQHY